MNRAKGGQMPQKVNPKKSDLSVSLGAEMRADLVDACAEDKMSLTQATKEAVENRLAARKRRLQRQAAKGK